MRNSGFTLIEVLLAGAIFALSFLAISRSITGARWAGKESQHLFEATQAAESKMSELEMKYQSKLDREGIDSTLGTENGSFEKPFEGYKWKVVLAESKIKLTRDHVEKFLGQLGVEEKDAAEKAEELRLVLANLNKLFKENFVEMRLTVTWEESGRKYSFPLVTHIIPTKPKIDLTATGEE